MSKKKTFIIPVYFKVKAEDYGCAEQTVAEAISFGLETDDQPPKEIKDWSFLIEGLQE